jgi:hypothetical protein
MSNFGHSPVGYHFALFHRYILPELTGISRIADHVSGQNGGEPSFHA